MRAPAATGGLGGPGSNGGAGGVDTAGGGTGGNTSTSLGTGGLGGSGGAGGNASSEGTGNADGGTGGNSSGTGLSTAATAGTPPRIRRALPPAAAAAPPVAADPAVCPAHTAAKEQHPGSDGVRLVPCDGGAEKAVHADLVVDATGRGSRTPTFLEDLGYGRPLEDEVVVHLTYVSQLLRIPANMLREQLVVVFPEPGRHTLMALARYENGVSTFMVGGMLGEEPPNTTAGMATFIEHFAPSTAVAAVRAAQPAGDIARYRFPSNRWRRYDKMSRFPQGLLPFGDAIASFNPIYGQGMTVAAMNALALRESLRHGEDGLPRRFLRASAKVVDGAWQMAAGSDLAFPEVRGPRSPRMRLNSFYTEKVLAAAETDPFVVERFLRAVGLVDPPTALLRPAVLRRVWAANRPRRADGKVASGTETSTRSGGRSD